MSGFRYIVGQDGNVYSLHSRRLLTPVLVPNGYLHVELREGGRSRQVGVHVLVAETFLGPRPPGYVVNHKNGDKADNAAENLEWVTQSENVQHAYRAGMRVLDQAHRERCAELGRAKRKTTPEIEVEMRGAFTGRRGDIERLAKRYGVTRYVVSRVVRER